jgi:hypothetical protein
LTSCAGNRRPRPEVHSRQRFNCRAVRRTRHAGALGCLAAAVLSACLAASAQKAAPDRLLPADDGLDQPDFFSFRARLQATIARRDVPALLAVIHPNIKNSFGGDDGIQKFRENWKLPAPDSELWHELAAVLALGGRFRESTFVAPYTFSDFPETLDAAEHVVVVGSEVRVRSAPRLDASVVGSSSFGILRIAQGALHDAGWTGVRINNGRTGYVAAALARSPLDYRAIFSRGPGGWRLVTFVAGD